MPSAAQIEFQSTLPIREETAEQAGPETALKISIHSSHTGRDGWNPTLDDKYLLFQSTLPIREETTLSDLHIGDPHAFQSTLPIREET